jgi:hypothetical protein
MSESKLPMTAGETLVDSFLANRMQGGRAVGGRFYLTSQRLAFLPNRVDAATGGDAWEIPLAAVSLADIAPRGSSPFSEGYASLRRRLRITTVHGTDLFVVNHVGRIVAQIQQARSA